MIKKISFLVLSVLIAVSGIIAFDKVNYWPRSAGIFKLTSNPQSGTGRGRVSGDSEFAGRGIPEDREGFSRQEGPGRGFNRPERGELPDTISGRLEAVGERPGRGIRNRIDTLGLQSGPGNGEQTGRISFEGGTRSGEGRGRGGYPAGSKINISNVKWFLALFAFFTVIAIYADKMFCLVRKRKRKQITDQEC